MGGVGGGEQGEDERTHHQAGPVDPGGDRVAAREDADHAALDQGQSEAEGHEVDFRQSAGAKRCAEVEADEVDVAEAEEDRRPRETAPDQEADHPTSTRVSAPRYGRQELDRVASEVGSATCGGPRRGPRRGPRERGSRAAPVP